MCFLYDILHIIIFTIQFFPVWLAGALASGNNSEPNSSGALTQNFVHFIAYAGLRAIPFRGVWGKVRVSGLEGWGLRVSWPRHLHMQPQTPPEWKVKRWMRATNCKLNSFAFSQHHITWGIVVNKTATPASTFSASQPTPS